MKIQQMALVRALAFGGCANHAARDRLAFGDATVLQTGLGATQDEAAGAPNSPSVTTYTSVANSHTALTSLQTRCDRLSAEANCYFHAKALENGAPLSAANPALRAVPTVGPDL
ncbi:hypothetical protein [Paraburkholderia ginsengiterrae]|nr:hypothetical protein [Paraburkholderia ginsengiterrae]